MNPFHEFGTYPKGYENKKICELQYCNYYFQECIGLDKQSLGHVLTGGCDTKAEGFRE